jgi:hypothetical protein
MLGTGKKTSKKMPKHFLIPFAILYCLFTEAQNDKNASRFRPGVMWYYNGITPAKIGKTRKYDRFMVDLCYNTWNGNLKPFKNTINSVGINTNVLFDTPLTIENTVSFGIGFSHTYIRIHTATIFKSDWETSTTTLLSKNDSISLPNKNFLGGHSFSIPIELRFRTKGWKHVKFHLGGRVGYQINLFTKAVINDTHGKSVYKDYLSDVNHLMYAAYARIGIRNWSLFTSYNLNSLFKNKQSTQLNLIQAGMTVSLF